MIVYVCPECGGESLHPGKPLHPPHTHLCRGLPPMEPVEFVPRRLADALADELEKTARFSSGADGFALGQYRSVVG